MYTNQGETAPKMFLLSPFMPNTPLYIKIGQVNVSEADIFTDPYDTRDFGVDGP